MCQGKQNHNSQAEPSPETGGVELYSLSAEVLCENDRNFECVSRLNEQIHKPNVYNIALTGAYGSGKTTILRTWQKKFTDNNKPLCISLANFNVAQSDDDNVKLSQKKEEELNRLLEYSIIQQLIYREDQDTLPESRFKRIRIRNITSKFISKIAGCVILFFACLLIIFQPSFVRSTSIYNFLTVPPTVKLIIDLLCVGIVIWLLFLFFSSIVRVWVNLKLNKITIKDIEVGFNDEKTNSILNKHIDEVLYYFEKTDYNVVIIEDLDRFKTPLIFSKLREINGLINSYKPIQENRKIVFIYAIRDDLFINKTLRTKFFDVIIPVISIVDSSNAGSKLRELFYEKVDSNAIQIYNSTFRDLGRFVAEMRLLKSIVNDYLIYSKILSDKLHPANLLAMMAYKNFYPQDFIALSNQKGLLYSVLNNKHNFTIKLRDKIDEQINERKQEILDIETQKSKSLKELKDLYLYRLLHQHKALAHFIDTDNSTKSLSDMYNEDLFRRLASGEITQYRNNNGSLNINLSFSPIQNEVDPNHTYAERAELWNKRENGEIGRLTQKIHQLEGEKLELPYKPISTLFVDEIRTEIDDYISSKNKDKLDTRLLLYVLQTGLIDSNYYNYISFFHEGLLSSSDNEFLMNITFKRNTPFSHPLHNHETLVDEIPLPIFKHSYVLNFSLLNFLCDSPRKYSQQLAYIFEQLKKADDTGITFVKEFVRTNDAAGNFLKLFSQNWDGLWLFIERHFVDDVDAFGYLIVKHLTIQEMKNINIDWCFRLFLEKNFDLFGVWETQIDNNRLIEVIDKLDLQFSSIDSATISGELFQFIEDKSHYDINNDNIKAVLKSNNKIDLLEKIDKAHYSSILESEVKLLVGYIENNLEYYTDKVLNLIETSKEENENALIKFINSNKIQNGPKKQYLLKQSGCISDLESVDAELWDLAIDSLIIFPTWSNVMKYYGKHVTDNPSVPLNDGFKNYLSQKAVFSELTNNKIDVQSDNKEAITSLFNAISSDNTLSDECYISILKSFNKEVLPVNMDLSGFSKAKISFLINTGLMPYTNNLIKQLKSHQPQLVPAYLTIHKDEYLENPREISLDSSQYSQLLSAKVFSPEEKITIAENIRSNELNEDSKLATLICQIIIDRSFDINEEVLKKIITLCESEQLKTDVVYKYLTTVIDDYDEDVVSEYLNLLSEDYQKITIKGKKPHISIDSHIDLLDYLKNKKYLKNVIPHDKHITVITRD